MSLEHGYQMLLVQRGMRYFKSCILRYYIYESGAVEAWQKYIIVDYYYLFIYFNDITLFFIDSTDPRLIRKS
jgi:hypothetical protein